MRNDPKSRNLPKLRLNQRVALSKSTIAMTKTVLPVVSINGEKELRKKGLTLTTLLLLCLALTHCGKKEELGSSAEQLFSGSIIVGDLQWKEVGDLVAGSPIKASAISVADVDLPSMESRCTGFLIAEDVLLTNHHCVPTAADSYKLTADFEHEAGKTKGVAKYDCSEFIGNNEELDFALLRCKGSPGLKYGYVKLSTRAAQTNESIYVVQQNCDYYTDRKCDWSKKFALGAISSTRSDGEYVHNADTLGGSSGSPVFSNSSHEVIALHHAGRGNNGFGRGTENYAVPMFKIRQKLSEEFPQVYAKLKSSSSSNSGQTGSGPSGSSRVTFEPNDDQGRSALLSLPFSSGLGHDLAISSSTDRDWYRVNVVSSRSVKVKLTIAGALKGKGEQDLDLYVVAGDGRVVAKSELTSEVEQLSFSARAGVYYIQVVGYRGARASYQLSVE